MQVDSGLLTLDEAAKYLRVKPPTTRKWRREGRFAVVKLGSRVYVRRSDLDALIQANTIPAKAA